MLKLHNSLTRQLEDFKPQHGKNVTMYNCGPTVYDYAHIGNLRSYLFADTLRRYLEYSGYTVKQVMNITDVGHMLSDADMGEDKMDIAAKREQTDPLTIARKYETQFMSDIGRLNIEPAFKYPRASEHVSEMIAMVADLLKKGIAYQVHHDVYFDITKFPAYGNLSGNTVDALKAGARVDVNDKKRNPYDFALWIYNPAHLMQWDAPWSRGYPGWHIECSAMSTKYLGETIDIHTGGEDNKFPHHECEIAQTEGVTGKPFVSYWLHASHLLVDGAKMSKSLNNFYRLDDLLVRGYEARAIRYALIASHYRENQNFTFGSIDSATSALEKIDNLFERLNSVGKVPETNANGVKDIVDVFERDFVAGMDDDINVSKALGSLFVFVRELNAVLDAGITESEKELALKSLRSVVVNVLGLPLTEKSKLEIPKEMENLLSERNIARANKDFALADSLRAQIESAGFKIVDSPAGALLKKI